MQRIGIITGCVLFLLLAFAPVRVARAVEATADPAGYLEEQGYVVTAISEGKQQNTGKPFAMVTMEWESKELWSPETSGQSTVGFYALRGGYPEAAILFVCLIYNSQYEAVWRTDSAPWDKYQKDKDWNAFSGTLWIGIWDNDAGEYMAGSDLKNFTRKNFGAGNAAPPKLPGPVKGGGYGGVALEADKTQVKLKSETALRIQVLDKEDSPVARAPVDLTLSGSATGSRVIPKSVMTDEDGIAKATFIAGSKDGAAVITANARGTTGAITIQVGKGESDPAPTHVTQSLQQKGYKVNGVGRSSGDSNSVYVDMPVAGTVADQDGNLDSETTTQVEDGWAALLDAYPKATTFTVITRTKTYAISWITKPQDFSAYLGQKLEADEFWGRVWRALKITDLKTGKPVTPKDFLSKNFG